MTSRFVRSSLLVAVVGIATVLAAPSAISSEKQPVDLANAVDWYSIRNSTICPAQVVFDRELRVMQVWCADGVEGQMFDARGQRYVCRSLRYRIPYVDSEIDVLGGCVARLYKSATTTNVEDQ